MIQDETHDIKYTIQSSQHKMKNRTLIYLLFWKWVKFLVCNSCCELIGMLVV